MEKSIVYIVTSCVEQRWKKSFHVTGMCCFLFEQQCNSIMVRQFTPFNRGWIVELAGAPARLEQIPGADDPGPFHEMLSIFFLSKS